MVIDWANGDLVSTEMTGNCFSGIAPTPNQPMNPVQKRCRLQLPTSELNKAQAMRLLKQSLNQSKRWRCQPANVNP
jgi:hypothetical protein